MHDAVLLDDGDCMADMLLQIFLPLQMRLCRHAALRCAALCCAMLCCAVPCRAVLCCAVLCCAVSASVACKEMVTRSSRHEEMLLMLTLTFHAGS